MESLSKKERELAAIGAAIAANCVPCIEYHIPEARKAGLSDFQILEAVKVAEKVRRVSAGKVLGTARALLQEQEASVEEPTPEEHNETMQEMMKQCCPDGGEQAASLKARFLAACCGPKPGSTAKENEKPTP
jgi:AhpD family alkylhydroperoxidase